MCAYELIKIQTFKSLVFLEHKKITIKCMFILQRQFEFVVKTFLDRLRRRTDNILSKEVHRRIDDGATEV